MVFLIWCECWMMDSWFDGKSKVSGLVYVVLCYFLMFYVICVDGFDLGFEFKGFLMCEDVIVNLKYEIDWVMDVLSC